MPYQELWSLLGGHVIIYITLVIYITFAGKPEPTIKWYKEGKNITDTPDFEISYREGRVKLMIPETFPEDAGKYTCTASNVGGTASSTAELIVRGKISKDCLHGQAVSIPNFGSFGPQV